MAQVLHRPGGAVLPGVDVPHLHLLIPEPEHLTQEAAAAVGDQPPEHRAGPPPAVELLRMLLRQTQGLTVLLQRLGQTILLDSYPPAKKGQGGLVEAVEHGFAIGVQCPGHGGGPAALRCGQDAGDAAALGGYRDRIGLPARGGASHGQGHDQRRPHTAGHQGHSPGKALEAGDGLDAGLDGPAPLAMVVAPGTRTVRLSAMDRRTRP